jgi:hypothetical protein
MEFNRRGRRIISKSSNDEDEEFFRTLIISNCGKRDWYCDPTTTVDTDRHQQASWIHSQNIRA